MPSAIKDKFRNQVERDNQAWDLFYQNFKAEVRKRTAGELGTDINVSLGTLHRWFLRNKKTIKDNRLLVQKAYDEHITEVNYLTPFYEDNGDSEEESEDNYDDDDW